MTRFILASLGTGVLFVLLDALINANPLAQRLHKAYSPIGRKALSIVPAIAIDLVYGFIIAGLYWLLYQALPGSPGVGKGMSLAVILWVLRVVMGALGQWVMFDVPASSHLYDTAAGLVEMLVVSVSCALMLGPQG